MPVSIRKEEKEQFEILAHLDSGSNISLISMNTIARLEQLGIPIEKQPTDLRIVSSTGHRLKTEYRYLIPISINNFPTGFVGVGV